jgi:hypothetical protein
MIYLVIAFRKVNIEFWWIIIMALLFPDVLGFAAKPFARHTED